MAEWNDRVREAADKAEEEVKRVVRYLNDEVVPDVRKHSSAALRVAADELRQLAQRLDDGK